MTETFTVRAMERFEGFDLVPTGLYQVVGPVTGKAEAALFDLWRDGASDEAKAEFVASFKTGVSQERAEAIAAALNARD